MYVEFEVREKDVFEYPEYAVRAVEAEVEVHASGVVVEVVHEEDDPEEGESFEGIDDMSKFDNSWST